MGLRYVSLGSKVVNSPAVHGEVNYRMSPSFPPLLPPPPGPRSVTAISWANLGLLVPSPVWCSWIIILSPCTILLPQPAQVPPPPQAGDSKIPAVLVTTIPTHTPPPPPPEARHDLTRTQGEGRQARFGSSSQYNSWRSRCINKEGEVWPCCGEVGFLTFHPPPPPPSSPPPPTDLLRPRWASAVLDVR